MIHGEPKWGPWGTDLHGIGCIVEPARGVWWENALVLGRMRGSTIIPDVHGECGVHLESATPDLKWWSWEYRLPSLERERVAVEVCEVDEDQRLLRLTFHNDDVHPHRYWGGVMSRLHGHSSVDLAQREPWVGAESYSSWQPPAGDRADGMDGFPPGVGVHHDLVDGMGLGFWGASPYRPFKGSQARRTHALAVGSRASWSLPRKTHRIWMRCGVSEIEGSAWSLAGQRFFPPQGELEWVRIELSEPLDHLELSIEAGREGERPLAVIDGFFLDGEGEPQLEFLAAPHHLEAQLIEAGLSLSEPTQKGWSGVVLSEARREEAPHPYGDGAHVQVKHSELSGWGVRRGIINAHLLPWGSHNATIPGDGNGIYHGLGLGPIEVAAGESVSCHVVLSSGGEKALDKARATLAQAASIVDKGRARRDAWLRRTGAWNCEGHRRLLSHVNANVSWPIRVGSRTIACDTPGKRWGGLFTWDSAMHGFGHLADDPTRALSIVRTYLGPKDLPSSPKAVLHGSPLALHLHLTWGWFQKTGDVGQLRSLLPDLARLLDWYLSRQGVGGPTGLITTYDHFYNGFGIDDDPLQHLVETQQLQGRVAPVAASSHTARACRIFALLAAACGEKERFTSYRDHAQRLLNALMEYSWNSDRGTFEWVWLEDGRAFGTKPEGAWNDGIDGLAPLCAGLDDPEVVERLVQKMTSEQGFQTPSGLTSVARSSSMAREDGYWNGAVWIPHQFLLFLGLLGHGRSKEALALARRAIRLHHEAAQASGHSYELFDPLSGQGEGCHNFAGLSAPVAWMHQALSEKGSVTTGPDALVLNLERSDSSLSCSLWAPIRSGLQTILVVAGSEEAKVTFQGSEVSALRDGDVLVLELNLDSERKSLDVQWSP